ncbi:hypothetical protein C1H76_7757 [Elsinoe australis]|uniref:Cell wall protein SED1 n=1 Tax=Elsinoe australis TaxID=40998 RepID=A0A4U7ASN1_9PEZI|nr:hypothetical protein C1H76_7757 [Elsinoe australis]
MRFTIAATAALVAGASATYKRPSTNDTTYVTEVVSKYTTYCPEATEISHNGVTYTVTSATTLTIEDCPCTVTKPAPSTTAAATTSAAATPSAYPTTSSAVTANPVPSSSSLSSYSAPATSSAATPSAYPTTSAATTANPVPSSSASAVYPTTAAPVPSYPAGNSTKPVGTGSVTANPPAYTGAAGKVQAAGLAAIFGLAALAL